MQYYKFDSKSLQYIKVNSIVPRFVPLILIGIIFLYTGFSTGVNNINVLEKVPITLTNQSEGNSPEDTKKYIKSLLKDCNIQNKEIVYRQIMLETGNLTSNVFLKANNLFGMKIASSRQKIQPGEYMGYAKYNSYKESILDYALFQANYCSGLSDEQYYQFLNQYYSETSDYVQRLKKIEI